MTKVTPATDFPNDQFQQRMTYPAASDRIRTISRHSLAYMLCAASEMFRHYDFDPIDLIIIHAVLNANVLSTS